MILTSSRNLEDTWTSIFRRKGDDGTYTRLCENLDASQRRVLLSQFELNNTEIPVIASVEDAANRLTMTTERLVCSRRGERVAAATQPIQDFSVDVRQLQSTGIRKRHNTKLEVTTIHNSKYLIDAEAGESLSGIWSVLKNMGARNRKVVAKEAI